MSSEHINDLIHFIAIEKENLLKNMANLGEDFWLIMNLDIMYQKCLNLNPIDKPRLKIPVFLYLNSHREYSIAAVSFLRLHQSKSFNCLRSALDSVFTAYYLLKNPDKEKVYLTKLIGQENSPKLDREWNKIFRNIKQTIKENIDNYPGAEYLPEIHEFCSIYSHSDAVGILHRYVEDREKLILESQYFDYELTIQDYKKWLACLLFSFFRIYLIFWNQIFKDRAGDKLKEIEKRIVEYDKRMRLFRDQYPSKEIPLL